MEKISTVTFNGITFDVGDLLKFEKVETKTNFSKLNLKSDLNFKDLNKEELEEFMIYLNKFTEVAFNPNDNYLTYMLQVLKLAETEDSTEKPKLNYYKTLIDLNPSNKYPYLLFSFIFIYINDKKNTKKTIKNIWCYFKMINYLTPRLTFEGAVKMTNRIIHYIKLKDSDRYMTLIKFYKMNDSNTDDIELFNDYRNKYRAIQAKFPNEVL
jgi:hypothetical protein